MFLRGQISGISLWRKTSLNGLTHKFLTLLWGTATDTYKDMNMKRRVTVNTHKDCMYILNFLDRLGGKEH